MKTQISRNSHNASKRYSGVYQQQGRMLTDADWNELADIVKDRFADVVHDIIGSGIPRTRGLIHVTGDGTPSVELRWGHVYVDGVVAQVRPDDTVSPASTVFDYEKQADFPSEPSLPGTGDYILYLDVWERAVLYFEDDALRDAGLHGADTCTRTQTMAQVKWCPTSIDPENTTHNPQRGNAKLNLQIRAGATAHDPCDPCADEVQLQERTGNYLFRAEIHDVIMGAGGKPDRMTLKWSSENGAEQYEVGNEPLGFKSDQWIYEFISGSDKGFASDKHLGVHHADSGWNPVRGVLTEGYPDSPPTNLTLVRRWDGYCELQRNSSDDTWSLVEVTGTKQGMDRGVRLSPDSSGDAPGHFTSGTTIEIKLDAIELELELKDKQLVAGDFWMVDVREAIHGPGSALLQDEEPAGILHHYLTLGQASGSGITWAADVWDAERLRQFGFPPLSDLNARDVGYTMPACETDNNLNTLLEQALGDAWPNSGDDNPSVRDILDTLLCRLDARHLPLEKDNNLCPELRDDTAVQSVQDAINVLCAKRQDGCCTYTVFPIKNWHAVFDKIGENEDAHVCFQAGTYKLDQPLILAKKGHISITGCGEGTRIIASKSEAVFKFNDCDSVTVHDVYLQAGVTGDATDREHLNGALTVMRCQNVDIEGVIARCAAGVHRAASCIAVGHDRLVRAGTAPPSVRIRASEARVGYNQVGILLINAHRAQIEDNQVRVVRKPRSFKLGSLVQDRVLRVSMRKNLIHDAVISKRLAGVTLTPTSGGTRTESKRSVALKVGDNEIRFNSSISQGDWDTLMSKYPAKDIRNNRDLLRYSINLANRGLLDKAVRATTPGLAKMFAEFAQNAPSIASQGIVCGGRVAGEVRILNNTVTGALETIHVGVSHYIPANQPQRADYAGTVIIQNNNLRVYLPALFKRGRHGIFVGNSRHLLIEDNRVHIDIFQSKNTPKVEGIRVYGFLGRMMIVRQNFIEKSTTGIYVKPLNQNDGQSNQWLVADNMMPNAATSVNAPGSVRKRDNFS